MRRMLDPKTIGGGGGGDKKLYCHCITLNDNQEINCISLNFFNESDTKFTITTLKSKLTGHKLSCSGSIVQGTADSGSYVPRYLRLNSSNNLLLCRATNVNNKSTIYIIIDDYNLTDDVMPA